MTPSLSAAKHWPIPALGGSKSGSPEVLFTFDDGPDGDLTRSVLDTLKKHDVHAIFFLVGKNLKGKEKAVQRNRDLALAEIAEGHSIGNHTYDHWDLCKKSTTEAHGAQELDENAQILKDLLGFDVVIARIPYGNRCELAENLLTERHLPHIHWDIDAQEWKTHDADKTQKFIIGEIKKLGDTERAVVLMHDIQPPTSKALPVILDWIDKENADRMKAGKRPIKIIGPSEVGMERLGDSWGLISDGVDGVEDLLDRPIRALTRS
jgi:peptidoglycan/xylan/chitin deacetylase (PgdA/CDA1 family)